MIKFGALSPQQQGFLEGKSTNAAKYDFMQSIQCFLDYQTK